MSGAYLSEDHRVIRQVPPRCQVKGDSGEFVGVNFNAFLLRENEEYLSVSWPEHFAADSVKQCQLAINQMRAVRSDRDSTAYWIAQISDLRHAMLGNSFRAISEPIGDFTSHAALRRWPRTNFLLELLAAETLAEVLFSRDVP